MKASIPSRIKIIVFRLAVFALLAGVVAPAYAQVSPRGIVTGTPPGRVLQAQQTSNCFVPTLKVTPSEVDKSGSLKFEVNVKNTCTTKQTAYVKVLYNDTLLLRNVTPGGAFGTPPAELSGGASKDFAFDVAVGGIQGLTKTTNFHAQVTMSRSPDAKSEPVPVVMKFITDENPVGSANCLLLNLIVAPTVIKAQSETLAFGLKLNNNCTGGIGPQLAVLYNKDQPINPIANPPWLAPGASDQVNFSWGAGGLQGLTGTTNFYAVAKYTDPASKKEVSVRSNVVAVSMEFSGVTPGDGGAGTGEGATLPPGAQTPTAGGATSCISITSGPICVINYVIAAVVQVFNSIVKYVLLRFLGPFIEALVSIRTYTDDFAQVIYSAWQILRNLGNIFFILSIVAIGVATVFRISGYAVKDLLVKLIVGAILINFSLTIAQAILGIADTVTNQFLGPNTGAIRAIVNPLVTTNIWANVTANAGDFSSSIQGVFSFWLSFAAFVAFLGVAFLLFFRIIMLWILLMLSPLPYVAMVLPATRKMSKTWWSKFIQWAFNAPIVAFMLNLTATITVANSNIIQKLANVQTGNSSEVTTFMFAVAGQAIPIAFLFMTVKAGASVGKGAAGFIDKAIDKGAKAAFLPAALTGAAVGGAVGAGAAAVAKTAKNAAAVPLDLAKLKFAEGRASRLNDIANDKATTGTKIKSFLAGDRSIGKMLEAKRKRYEGDTKHYKGASEEYLKDIEKNRYSWAGAKVLGNKIKTKGSNLAAKLQGADTVQDLARLKTDQELQQNLKDAKYTGSLTDTDAMKQQIELAKEALKDPKISDDAKKDKEKLIKTLDDTVRNMEIRANNNELSKAASVGANELNKVIHELREPAQTQLAKSEYAPSYIADKHRRENTKGAASRLPSEYSLGEYADFFKKAVAKGDKYGALLAAQTIEQEGDTKDMLKQFGYTNNSDGLKKFYKDYFRNGTKGFDVGAETYTTLLRESDKRTKSAGDWDLAGKIKYDTGSGKYEEDGAGRIGKNVDKRIGEGSINDIWRGMTTKTAMTYNIDAESGEGKWGLSDHMIEALKKMNPGDPMSMQALTRTNSPMARNITTLNGSLKDDPKALKEIEIQFKDAIKEASKARGRTEQQQTEDADKAYMMVKYASNDMTAAEASVIKDVVTQVNDEAAILSGRRPKQKNKDKDNNQANSNNQNNNQPQAGQAQNNQGNNSGQNNQRRQNRPRGGNGQQGGGQQPPTNTPPSSTGPKLKLKQ